MTKAPTIKVAQVGCGYWGKNLVRNFAEIGALAAISDGHAPTAEQMSKNFGVPALNWKAILANPSIDAVSLATPAAVHADMALAAIAAGKHVFVEKPLALNSTDAARVVAAAETANRTLMIGHLLQYHPIFRRLCDLVSDGTIGAINYIFSNRMSLGKFRTEENVLWSFAPHDVSMILTLVGEEPTHVTAQGAAFITPGVADWATMQLIFPGGVRGHIQTSWASPYKEQRLAIVGRDAMLVFDDAEPDWGRKLAIYRHHIDRSGPVPVPDKADAVYIDVPHGEPLKAECLHFLEKAVRGERPLSDGREGLRVLKVLERGEVELAASLRKTGKS